MTQTTAVHGEKISLLRVLGPAHVWALGVGIVLVGEYMGWNFAVGKGGMSRCAYRLLGGGPALHLRRHDRFGSHVDGRCRRRPIRPGKTHCRPLMAFNVGLYLVFAYTMLEAANAITLGYLVQTVRDHGRV